MIASPTQLCLVTPVFNDWVSLAKLLAELDEILQLHGAVLDVIAVNDASTTIVQAELLESLETATIRSVTILDVRTNTTLADLLTPLCVANPSSAVRATL